MTRAAYLSDITSTTEKRTMSPKRHITAKAIVLSLTADDHGLKQNVAQGYQNIQYDIDSCRQGSKVRLIDPAYGNRDQ